MFRRFKRALVCAVSLALTTRALLAQTVIVTVDPTQDRAPISALIYGINYLTAPFGTVSSATISDLNAGFVRNGGNLATRYNWQLNVENHGRDFYFESLAADGSPNVDQRASDLFIATVRNGGAEPTATIPTIDWLSKLGAGGAKLASFSIAKYGDQLGSDAQYFPDAGNGLLTATGRKIIVNAKSDASAPNSLTLQMGFVDYLQVHPVTYPPLRYFTMDNEPDLWADTHRDVVRPDNGPADPSNEGDKSGASVGRLVNYARMVKQRAPGAIVLAPETSSWFGYLVSPFDRQYANNRADNGDPNAYSTFPLDGDLGGGYRTVTAANPDGFYLPWLLGQLAAVAPVEGRLVDYFTLHYYPDTVALNADVSPGTQTLRSQSTRSLWDPTYIDPSYIGTQIRLIPRMKEWISRNYPGTKTGITEFNWGADDHINGGTTLADVLGIFGREGLDLATVFPTPNAFAAAGFKMFRNYNGAHATFGETRVRLTPIPDPNNFGFYAAQRSADGRLTLMLINKGTSARNAQVNLAVFVATGTAELWRLSGAGPAIQSLPPSAATLTGSQLALTLPAQSVTLAVLTPTPASLYAQWQAAHFTPGQIADANVGGWLADPDRDGIPNWLAFLCDLPPLGGANGGDFGALPAAGRERIGNTEYVTLTYRRNILAAQTSLTYESSTDLAAGGWQAIAPDLVESLAADAVTGDPQIRAKFATGNTRRFVRLRVDGP